jgi:ubiquinone/menaquinone biosynthesis C-methylase UbiE
MLHSLMSRPWIFDLGATFYAWFTAQDTWRASCAHLIAHFPAPAATNGPARPLLVVDLGCGPGVTAIEMARRKPDAHVIGLDLAPRMLSEARRYTEAAGLQGRIDYVLADASHLPFAPDTLDVLTGHSFLYLVGNRAAVLSESYRVLRRGGHYVSMEPHGGGADWRAVVSDYGRELRMMTAILLWRPFSLLHGQLTIEKFRALLQAAGFQNLSCELTLHGLGVIGDGEKPPAAPPTGPSHSD